MWIGEFCSGNDFAIIIPLQGTGLRIADEGEILCFLVLYIASSLQGIRISKTKFFGMC